MIYDRERRLAHHIAEATGISRDLDPDLCDIARKRAKDAVTVMEHKSPLLDAIAAQGIGWGEVLGFNRFYPHPVSHIVYDWMHSDEHRRVIKDGSYPVIGCGIHIQWWSLRWYFCAIVTTKHVP